MHEPSARLRPSLRAAAFFVLAVQSFLPATALAARGERPEYDFIRLLPLDVQTVVHLRSAPEALDNLTTSTFRAFASDARAGGLLDPLIDTLSEDSPEIASILDGHRTEDNALFAGEVMLARFGPEERDGEKRTLLIFAHNDHVAARRLLSESPRRAGERVTVTSLRDKGMRYDRVRRERTVEEKAETDKPSGRRRSLLGTTPGVRPRRKIVVEEEDVYIGAGIAMRASVGGNLIHEPLQRIKDADSFETLYASADFQGATSRLTESPDFGVYYDFGNLTRGGRPLIDPELLGRGARPENLGLDEIRSGALSIYLDPGLTRIEMNIFGASDRRGLGSLVFLDGARPVADAAVAGTDSADKQADPADAQWRALMPDDAVGYSVLSADIPRVWNNFRDVLFRSAPGVLQLMDSYLQSLNEGFDTNVERDLIGGLGDEWILFSRPASVQRRRTRVIDPTYMIRVRPGTDLNPSVRRWLTASSQTLNYSLDISRVGDVTWYHMVGAEAQAGQVVDVSRMAKICVTPEWFMLSPRFEHMEEVVRRIEAGLGAGGGAVSAESLPAAGRRTMLADRRLGVPEGLPADRFFEFHVRPEAFSMLTEDPFLGIFGMLLGGLGDSVARMEDLPDEREWDRHFGPVSGSLSVDGDVMTLLFRLPSADQKPGEEVAAR